MNDHVTEARIAEAQPRDKPYKLSVGKGLFLLVTPEGGKWWRLKYRRQGKENQKSLGVYPQVSLRIALNRRDEMRKRLAEEKYKPVELTTYDKFLRLPEVLKLIPISKSAWWNWVSIGKAPASIKLGDRMTVWREKDIHAFIDKLGESNEPAPITEKPPQPVKAKDTPKIIQIAAPVDGSGSIPLFALYSDGDLWCQTWDNKLGAFAWHQIPQPPKETT